ncbi:hypothetical protein [Poseidonibacter lekithochrous]|uniref:hypothetical protein n=1 Tax=Poseidonibacter lekithochrous TaxID=1904463 RepID=UPI0008FC7DBF|nr:hypothetical protein [Poseidonibacter lekithochrous]QKJ22127.1 putative membrane protein [Poseidonibacter lekithochrous]
MFKQVKSALFWYYLYKFRKRVILIFLLLIVALFANAIYGDLIEYLKLKKLLQYLELALISKWVIILFNLTFSIYLILTMFKKEDEVIAKQEEKKTKKAKPIVKEKVDTKEEKFTDREKQFLHKKKIRSKADLLVDK